MSEDLHLSSTTPTSARVVGLCKGQKNIIVQPFGANAKIMIPGLSRQVKERALATGLVEVLGVDNAVGLVRLLNVVAPSPDAPKLGAPGM